MPSRANPNYADADMPPIWCGPEGWLTGEEFINRTKRDVEAYARDNPLRYATAMISRDEKGRPLYAFHRQRFHSHEKNPDHQKSGA